MQWLRDTDRINVDNMINLRQEITRYFRNKKREYMKYKLMKLKSVSRRTLEICVGAAVTLRRATNVELM